MVTNHKKRMLTMFYAEIVVRLLWQTKAFKFLLKNEIRGETCSPMTIVRHVESVHALDQA